MQAPGGVGDHGVCSPSLGRLQGIVNHGARVSAGLLPNHRTSGPLAPDHELLGGGGPKGVSGAQQNLATLGSQAMGELADGSGLAHSVHAYHQNDLDDRSPSLRTGLAVGLAQDLEHVAGDQALDLLAVPELVARQPRAHVLEDFVGGLDTQIGTDQGHLEVFKQLRIELPGAFENVADLIGEGPARLRNCLPKAPQQARFFRRGFE